MRTVPAIFEDTIELLYILNQEAVVCIIWRDVCHQIQVLIEKQATIVLETVDLRKSQTVRLVSKMNVVIDRVDLVIPFYVVENALFQALLGRLFFVLTKCKTKDYKDRS